MKNCYGQIEAAAKWRGGVVISRSDHELRECGLDHIAVTPPSPFEQLLKMLDRALYPHIFEPWINS